MFTDDLGILREGVIVKYYYKLTFALTVPMLSEAYFSIRRHVNTQQ